MDFEQESSQRGPARSGVRSSLLLLTQLRSTEGAALGRARIRNLSATGLMADCEHVVDNGARVDLELRGIGRIRGTVVWVRNDRIGLSFDDPIDPQLVRKPVSGGGSGHVLPDYLRTRWIARGKAASKS